MGGVGSGRKKARLPPEIPMSEVRPKTAPKWLDSRSREIWKRLVDVLDRMPGYLREPDWYLVAQLACHLGRQRYLLEVLSGENKKPTKLAPGTAAGLLRHSEAQINHWPVSLA